MSPSSATASAEALNLALKRLRGSGSWAAAGEGGQIFANPITRAHPSVPSTSCRPRSTRGICIRGVRRFCGSSRSGYFEREVWRGCKEQARRCRKSRGSRCLPTGNRNLPGAEEEPGRAAARGRWEPARASACKPSHGKAQPQGWFSVWKFASTKANGRPSFPFLRPAFVFQMSGFCLVSCS